MTSVPRACDVDGTSQAHRIRNPISLASCRHKVQCEHANLFSHFVSFPAAMTTVLLDSVIVDLDGSLRLWNLPRHEAGRLRRSTCSYR